MKEKKVLVMVIVGIMAIGSILAGCSSKYNQGTAGQHTKGNNGSSYAKDAKLKVWGSQEDQEMCYTV